MAKFRYNGVILPGFPAELDQDAYPCAFIVKSKGTNEYYLACTSAAVHASAGDSSYGITDIMWGPQTNPGRGFVCTADSAAWSVDAELDADMSGGTQLMWFQSDLVDFIWTNTDIKDSAGVLYYAATDAEPAFDLKNWLTGFMLGLAGKPLPLAGGERDG